MRKAVPAIEIKKQCRVVRIVRVDAGYHCGMRGDGGQEDRW